MNTLTNEQQNAIAMSPEILSNSQDINNILTTSGQVRAVFHTHYVNLETKDKGIADLICQILKENGSVFPKDCEQTELRGIAIAGAMFTEEILTEVWKRFSAGSVRYPKQTVKAYLSVWLSTDSQPGDKKMLNRKARVGKIKLSSSEDSERECDKPRCKWFLFNNQ